MSGDCVERRCEYRMRLFNRGVFGIGNLAGTYGKKFAKKDGAKLDNRIVYEHHFELQRDHAINAHINYSHCYKDIAVPKLPITKM